MSVSMDWKPKRVVQEKIRDMNKNNCPDRLKNPQGRPIQKLRIKRQSNCIRSGTVNLGHPVIKRPLIQSICKSKQIKDQEQWQFKVVRENNGYCTIPIYLPFSKFFKKICGTAPLAGHHSFIELEPVPIYFGTLIYSICKKISFLW